MQLDDLMVLSGSRGVNAPRLQNTHHVVAPAKGKSKLLSEKRELAPRNYGQQLQAVFLGFTGIRISPSLDPHDWLRYNASLPTGWDSLRVERLTLAGRTCSVLARHGERTTLNCSA